MIQATNRNAFLPASIGAIVLVIGLSLLVITARGPYTHANLNLGYDPSYTRTQQTFVGAPMPLTGGKLAVIPAGEQAEHGRQLFVVMGCAGCHGIDGRGGVVGPSIIGKKASKLRSTTLVGPQGMPAYSPDGLTDEDLAAIAAFLGAGSK
jgi:mono/diheme cytochrome c family protein